MADNSHLFSVTYTLYNVTTMNYYYKEFFEKGQQKIYFNLYQLGLPSGDSVYTLKKVLEELNYESLLAQYSNKGRKGYNPIMMFAVLIYAKDGNHTLEKQAAYNLNIMRKLALHVLKLYEAGRKPMSLKKKRFAICTNPTKHIQAILAL